MLESFTSTSELIGPKWTHCRKALVTEHVWYEFDQVRESQMDSLPKGIGDTILQFPRIGPFSPSQMDSLPKGIGDSAAVFGFAGRLASQMDSLPKGIGDLLHQFGMTVSGWCPKWTHCRKALVTGLKERHQWS